MRRIPRKAIEEYVVKLREYWTSSYDDASGMTKRPYDPKKLVEALDGKCDIVRPDDWDPEWGTGYIRVLPSGTFEIGVPCVTSENRDRFTIAHELGHLYLHLDYADPEKWEKRVKNAESQSNDEGCLIADSFMTRAGQNYNEYEANDFAAAMLMPAKEFRKIAREKTLPVHNETRCNTREVAKAFGVSLEAAVIRGRFLGIFEWV